MRVLLVCHAGPGIGLGHLARTIALAGALRANQCAVKIAVFGQRAPCAALDEFEHSCIPLSRDLYDVVPGLAQSHHAGAVVFDVFRPLVDIVACRALIEWLHKHGAIAVGVDSLIGLDIELDIRWLPSICAPSTEISNRRAVRYGWDTLLLRPRPRRQEWSAGPCVLVLSGGADVINLGQTFPELLDAALPPATEIHWVRGPFANWPKLPTSARLKWTIHDAPASLDDLYETSNYAICVYGVSVYELLQSGVPTVVLAQCDSKDRSELDELMGARVARVAFAPGAAINFLKELISDASEARAMASAAADRFKSNGALNLAAEMLSLAR